VTFQVGIWRYGSEYTQGSVLQMKSWLEETNNYQHVAIFPQLDDQSLPQSIKMYRPKNIQRYGKSTEN